MKRVIKLEKGRFFMKLKQIQPEVSLGLEKAALVNVDLQKSYTCIDEFKTAIRLTRSS